MNDLSESERKICLTGLLHGMNSECKIREEEERIGERENKTHCACDMISCPNINGVCAHALYGIEYV